MNATQKWLVWLVNDKECWVFLPWKAQALFLCCVFWCHVCVSSTLPSPLNLAQLNCFPKHTFLWERKKAFLLRIYCLWWEATNKCWELIYSSHSPLPQLQKNPSMHFFYPLFHWLNVWIIAGTLIITHGWFLHKEHLAMSKPIVIFKGRSVYLCADFLGA